MRFIKLLVKGTLPTVVAILLCSTVSASPTDPERDVNCPGCTFAQKQELICKQNCEVLMKECVDKYIEEKSQGTCKDNYTVMGIRNCEALEREASRDPACSSIHDGCYDQCKL